VAFAPDARATRELKHWERVAGWAGSPEPRESLEGESALQGLRAVGSRAEGRKMNLLLVTGAPRSGTTAVGYNLALPRSAGLLYEPFNYVTGLRDIERQFEIPGAGSFSQERLDDVIQRLRKLDLRMKNGRRAEDTPLRALVKRIIGGRSNLSYMLCRLNPMLRTIIWKDPMAVFTSRAVASRHGITVLATVRPPVAVAASFARLNWRPDVEQLIASFHEKGWQADIPAVDVAPGAASPAIRGAMIWEMVYRRLLAWSAETEQLYLINIQAVVDDAVNMYRDLYALCHLPWNKRVETAIAKEYARRSSGGDERVQPLPGTAHVKNRDLRRINEYGKRLLSEAEKDAVAAMTETTWRGIRTACDRDLARLRFRRPSAHALAAAS
jgi:hypothetical protein